MTTELAREKALLPADDVRIIKDPARKNGDTGIMVWLALAGILLASAFLLFFQLGDRSLWVDEIFTAIAVRQPTFQDFLVFQLSNERQPPFQWLILYLVIQLTGQHSDFIMRLPSAGAGVAAVFSMFWLGRTLGGNRLGLLVSFLLALSPMFVLYSRMARYYSFSLLFAVLSCLFFLLWVKAQSGGLRGWSRLMPAAYVLSTLLMLLSAYPTVSILLCQNLYALLEIKRKRFSLMSWATVQPGVAAGFGAWIYVVLPVMLRYRVEAMPFAVQGIKKVALIALYPFYSFAVGETIFPWQPAAIVGIIVIAGLLIVAVFKGSGDYAIKYSLFMFIGTLTGTFLIFLFVIVDIPFITAASRSIFSLPFFLLLVASGLLTLKRKALRLLLGGSLAAVYALSLFNYYMDYQFHNPIYAVPAREITSEIIGKAGSEDVIISDWDVGVEYYWPKGQSKPVHFLGTDTDKAITYITETGKPRVWLVTFGRDKTKGYSPDAFIGWLDSNYVQKIESGYAQQDPVYREIKRAILGYEDYEYKAMVTLYSN